MKSISINLDPNLERKILFRMNSRGFNNIHEYIEYALNRYIDHEDSTSYFPLVIDGLKLINIGDFFSVNDLIKEADKGFLSISLLQELDELLQIYFKNTNQNHAFEIVFMDPLLFINNYLKTSIEYNDF